MPTTTITDEQLAELKRKASIILAETRMAFQRQQPFTGSISMTLDLIPTRDARNPTAATDGSAIYFDISFLSQLSPTERMFILGHEVYHNVMLHFIRQEGRDRILWNLATDMEVNTILEDDGLLPPKDCILPKLYGFASHKSAEEYYQMLIELQKNNQMPNAGGNSNGQSSSGSGSGSNSNNSSAINGQFDSHIYEDDNVEEQPIPEGATDRYGSVGKDVDFTPNVKEQIIEKIREAAVAAAQEIERARGDLPAHLQRLVNKLTESKVDWKDVLARFVTRNAANEPTWNRPNRRFVHTHTYLPGHEGKELNIAVVIDTSGSTVVDSETFLSELNAIVNSYPAYKMNIIHCDTEVNHVEEYSNEIPFIFDPNAGYEFHGGGGTCLNPALQYLDANGIDVDVAVVFTDGWCETFSEDMAPNYPVLWLLTDSSTKDHFKFGEVVEFKHEAK